MYKRETTIKNETGLHARPASDFIKCAGQFQSKLTIHRVEGAPQKMDNAKSMITLLTSAFAYGERVEICGDGEDEQAAVDALIDLIDHISE